MKQSLLVLLALALLAACRGPRSSGVPVLPPRPLDYGAPVITATPAPDREARPLAAATNAVLASISTEDRHTLTEAVQNVDRLLDTLFDYNQSNLRPDAREALTTNAERLAALLARNPAVTLTIEGHCDERGSAEFNIALGEMRAAKAREFLEALGLPAAQMRTVSYGKERPQCAEATADCYQRNRRAHLVWEQAP